MTDKTETDGAPPEHFWQKRRLPPLAADMAVCFAACFTAYAYYHDNASFFSGVTGANHTVRMIMFAAMVLAWVTLSVQNGARGRLGFLAFTIIFWIAPLAAGLFISAGDPASASGVAAQALNIALFFIKTVVQSPMAGIDYINGFLPVTNAQGVCALTAVFAAAFLISYLITATINKKAIANIERSGHEK